MEVIMITSSVIPLPNGADITIMKGVKKTIHLFDIPIMSTLPGL